MVTPIILGAMFATVGYYFPRHLIITVFLYACFIAFAPGGEEHINAIGAALSDSMLFALNLAAGVFK